MITAFFTLIGILAAIVLVGYIGFKIIDYFSTMNAQWYNVYTDIDSIRDTCRDTKARLARIETVLLSARKTQGD